MVESCACLFLPFLCAILPIYSFPVRVMPVTLHALQPLACRRCRHAFE